FKTHHFGTAMTGKKRFQILIAEDNQADVALVREVLTRQDRSCDILDMNDGAQVISYLRGLDSDQRTRTPDLVLLDIHLPKYEGQDIVKALRSTERSAQKPVVIMTGAPVSTVENIAQKHVALYYFCKPSTWSGYAHLGAVVRNLLDGREDGGE